MLWTYTIKNILKNWAQKLKSQAWPAIFRNTKEKSKKYKGKSSTNLFCPLLLIERRYQFNFLTGDLHFYKPLNSHPTCPYLWPNSHISEGSLSRNDHNGPYGLTIYGHGYGQGGCLFKDMKKCRSPVKKLN